MERQFLSKYAIKETFSIRNNTDPAFLNHAENHLLAKPAKVLSNVNLKNLAVGKIRTRRA